MAAGLFLDTQKSVIRLGGADAVPFLDGLVTVSLKGLGVGGARHGALLTPQGKIVAQLIVHASEGALLIETATRDAEALIKRLTLYRLRAKVTIETTDLAVLLRFPDGSADGLETVTSAPDPRLATYCERLIVSRTVLPELCLADGETLLRRRIEAGLCEAPNDMGEADSFAHDVALDLTHGVSFDKGCYIGQEIVSRMQHLGGVRKRPLIARSHAPLVHDASGVASLAVSCGDQTLGTLTSLSGALGLGIFRLDKVESALRAAVESGGPPILCGESVIQLETPAYASYRLLS